MENIDFSRLNSTSFERLIRALCFKVFGSAGIVYSSGSDGARDFTFEGPINGYSWSGYLVVQAKFKETLQTPAQNLAWLKKQIAGEKKKYLTRKIRRPAYYILATNIGLSGADGKTTTGKTTEGGYTKISKLLDDWQKDIGIEGHDVWPADKISDLLAGFEDVRQTYAAWITPGDVLENVMKKINFKEVNFQDAMRKALRNSLRRDQFARLRDAGDVAEPQIRTSQIFIDLPIYTNNFTEQLYLEQSEKIVAKLADRAKDKLDTLPTDDKNEGLKASKSCKNKIVILGGPGQGKSTASMFAAQLFRAAILNDWSNQSTDFQTKKLTKEILDRANEQLIQPNITKRFPIFLALPRFADAISSARAKNMAAPSLITQICSEFSIASDTKVDKRDLRTWLKSYPWIVILDGLDEVPPSGERLAILDAIATFEGEIADASADILLIVTTRPQGYNDDLPEESWEHWTLDNLSSKDAIAYGEVLGQVRYPDDVYRRNDILTALKAAATNPTISRLMISPLQVTIMHMIVDTGGSVPSARWTLFSEYFEILRKREKAKGGENQKILERNWNVLGPIHQRAGLILQTDSEHAGAAQAFLNADRFLQLVQDYFRSEGFNEAEISSRSKELVEVALHRLVLLSARDEGKITFDVRSLQEFMAAGALTSGPPDSVQKRLVHIARMSHWRHVFLIAASRCFSENVLHHLRHAIVCIPREIETTQPDNFIRSGSKLALELFVDGIGMDHPVSRRMLATHAMELLNSGGTSFDKRLENLTEEQTDDIVRSALTEKISYNSTSAAITAWAFLLFLTKKKPESFLELAIKLWPNSTPDTIEILKTIPVPLPSTEIINHIVKALCASNPLKIGSEIGAFTKKFIHAFEPFETEDELLTKLDSHHKKLYSIISNWRSVSDDRCCSITIENKPTELKLILRTPEDCKNNFSFVAHNELSEAWQPLLLAKEFSDNPSAVLLAKFIKKIGSIEPYQGKHLISLVPWQLSCFLSLISNQQQADMFAEQIVSGEFGTAADWHGAQNRWKHTGIDIEHLDVGNSQLPFSQDISNTGTPFFGCGMQLSYRDNDDLSLFSNSLRIASTQTQSIAIEQLSELTLFSTVNIKSLSIPLSENLRTLLKFAANRDTARFYSPLLFHLDKEVWEDESCIASLSEIGNKIIFLGVLHMKIDLELILDATSTHTTKRGLITILAIAFFFQSNDNNKKNITIPQAILEICPDDTSRVKMSKILIQQYFNIETDYKEFESLVKNRATRNFAVELLNQPSIAGARTSIIKNLAPTLLRASDRPYSSREQDLMTLLEKSLATRQSELSMQCIWKDNLNLWDDAFRTLQKPS
ncbi:NACHT domain-containing protein [Pseudomonas sp. BF-B-26]|uniref:NACHT domain-containing protein n=1 Tax=Pseudomonas sp. BF-B-26 TaxID=2832400 RepID=UPI001CBEFA32|nr:hypothetical protein [Pseudomonas sp. BF-B-26]